MTISRNNSASVKQNDNIARWVPIISVVRYRAFRCSTTKKMMKRIKIGRNDMRGIVHAAVVKYINGEERQSLKEEFRKLHRKAETLSEDVMSRYYGINTNKNKPVLLEKITLNRVLEKHGSNGMINISANRSDLPQDVNDKNIQELIKDIKDSGFSYLPTYGGCRGNDGAVNDYEPSFVVFNYGIDGQPRDFQKLFGYALTWCGKYNQNSVLIKAPNKNPIWVDKEGNKVNSRKSDKYWKNDPSQAFFIVFKDKDSVNKEVTEKLKGMYKTCCHKNNIPLTNDEFEDFVKQNLNKVDSIGRRNTYDICFDDDDDTSECYVNPMPCQLSERMRRKGEVMIWDI